MNAVVVQHPNYPVFCAGTRVDTEIRRLQSDTFWITLRKDTATGLQNFTPELVREFQGMKNPRLVERLTLERHAGDLAGRAVWLLIGDRDERVGTDQTIALARRITSAALQARRPALVELHVLPEPQGHTTPRWAWSCEQAADWIHRSLTPAKAASAPRN